MIEGRVGEGTAAVSCLEDYCECIYQVHEALEQRRSMEGSLIYEKEQFLRELFRCNVKDGDILLL